MQCTGKVESISLDYTTRKPKITLLLNENVNVDEIKDIDKLSIEIKKHRVKRSLNANSYFWTLCNKLSDKLNITPKEVYREYIKDLNVCKQMILPRNDFNTFKTAWGMLGIGWVVEELDITDKDEILANFHYGSSTYNSKQMARLIDNIVQDCKEQGIDTISKAELNKMVKEWNA